MGEERWWQSDDGSCVPMAFMIAVNPFGFLRMIGYAAFHPCLGQEAHKEGAKAQWRHSGGRPECRGRFAEVSVVTAL